MTHRMFVAANPTDDVAAALERFVEPRRQDGSTLRWVHWGQWHLTLAFFGTVPGRRVDDLGDLLDEVALNTDPVELTVGRAGAFLRRMPPMPCGSGSATEVTGPSKRWHVGAGRRGRGSAPRFRAAASSGTSPWHARVLPWRPLDGCACSMPSLR